MRNMIQAQEQMMEKMERWGETERRRLHNIIQELKGNIRVFCRARPMLALEAGDKSVVTAGVIAGEITVLDEKHRQKKVGICLSKKQNKTNKRARVACFA